METSASVPLVLLLVVLIVPESPAGPGYRIGFLGLTSSADYAPNLAAFRQGLSDLGHEEGKNISIEYRWAENRCERLPGLAVELVRLRPDALVTHAAVGIRAAQQATSSTSRSTQDRPRAGPDHAPLTPAAGESGSRMTGRRRFLVGLGGVLAAPRFALGQQVERTNRVCWLSTGSLPKARAESYNLAFMQRPRELGFVEGRNCVIEFRGADGQVDSSRGHTTV
jgi:hypothetical protein